MSEEERAEAILKSIKEANAKIKERKAAEIKAGFLNPFGEKTSYSEFLEQVGKKTVAEYCKDKLTAEELAWLENELLIFKEAN